jgi:hypothetical protein
MTKKCQNSKVPLILKPLMNTANICASVSMICMGKDRPRIHSGRNPVIIIKASGKRGSNLKVTVKQRETRIYPFHR